MGKDLKADHSLKAEETAAQLVALRGRVIALALVAVLITFLTTWPGPVYVYVLLFLFLANGYVAYRFALADSGRPWHQYVFVSIDTALLTFTLLFPNPLLPIDFPVQFNLRNGVFIYFFVILAGLTYVYRPQLVVWGGISAAVFWLVGLVWIMMLPDTVWQIFTSEDFDTILKVYMMPTYVDLGIRAQEVAVFLIVAGLLALAVSRARTIALRQADLAQERANLARYFPSQTADLLASQTDPFAAPREHNAAVLFADLVSFTAWSQKRPPTETIALLRDVHRLLAEIVFRHGGTLDKFVGDGLMATFGTPAPGRNDAANALAASVQLSDRYEAWRVSQTGEGQDLPRLSVGVHYGPIIMGDVGIDQRLEFAVLGDTVNVASRLEHATRELQCRCLLSVDLLKAAETEDSSVLLRYQDRLSNRMNIALRGRDGKTAVATVY